MSGSSSPLAPTYQGIVLNTRHALVLFEACLSGRLNHVPRRPHDRERTSLIRSGNIFIYEEHASGIKRWTDGLNWSPSRILGNFLVYRELDGKLPPGEKKRALKSKSPVKHTTAGGAISKPGHKSSGSGSGSLALATNTHWGQPSPEEPQDVSDQLDNAGDDRDPMRQLVGSLTESYGFKEDGGLVKKTISVKINGVSHHLVNYYSLEDAMAGNLQEPWFDPLFKDMHIRPELLQQTCFRTPISADFMDGNGNFYITNLVGAPPGPLNNATMARVPGPGPVMPSRPHYLENQSFDEFGPTTPNHLGQLPGQLPGPLPGQVPAQLPHSQVPTPTPMPTQHSGQFPGSFGGGYQMAMGVANNFPQTHTPSNFQPHSSFDGSFGGQFGTPSAHGHSLRMDSHGNSDGTPSGFAGNTYNNLTDADQDYQLEHQFPDYGGQ